MAGGPEAKSLHSRGWPWALVLGGLVALAVTLAVQLGANEDGSGTAARRAAASVPDLIEGQPRLAALAALASSRLDSSRASELAMATVAASQPRVLRSLQTSAARVTAARRVDGRLTTSGSDSVLRMWRLSDGAQIAAVAMPRPLTRLASGYGNSLVAAADSGGALWAIDLSDPRLPRPVRLTTPARRHPAILATGLDDDGRSVFAVDRLGEVTRIDFSTGRLLERWSVSAVTGSAQLDLAAASFEPDGFTDGGEGLIVVRIDGEVVKLNLERRTAKTLLEPGVVPGRALAVDEEIYGTPRLLVGSTGGLTSLDRVGGSASVLRGPPVNGVAFDEEAEPWFTDHEGLHRESQPGESLTQTPTEPAEGLVASDDGLVAIGTDGSVTLPGPVGSGIRQEDIFSTPISTFGPGGNLLTAEGSDANHITELQLLRPGRSEDEGELVANAVARTYELSDSWWPTTAEMAEEGGSLSEVPGLYLADAVLDRDYLLAAGQDPLGNAALLAWDARSGRPLRHLSLSIGDVDSEEPSVLTNLVPLPGKRMVAAYSSVQQLVAIWSTETWRLLSVVPVGAAASLSVSPDESTLVTVSLGEEEGVTAAAGSRLTFIDVDAGRVSSQVKAPEAVQAAWSPNREVIAVAGQDRELRLLSAGRHEEVRSPIDLDGEATGLAWRPDGELLALAVDYEGVVLLDPESGETTPPLPAEPERERFDVEWSPDGERLVAGVSTYNEELGYSIPQAPDLWWLGRPRLERRMCMLAGGPIDPEAWRRIVGPVPPPRSLCHRHDRIEGRVAERDGELDRPVLAYRRGRDLFAADANGHSTAIGRVDDDYEEAPFVWSADALGWVTSSQAAILVDGASSPELWTCPCSGAAWRDGALYSLRDDGGALLRFRPGKRWPEAIRVSGLAPYSPRLIGFIGDDALVAAFGIGASGASLYSVRTDGQVVGEGEAPGTVFAVASRPGIDRLAFAAIATHGGPCVTSPEIGVARVSGMGIDISYPALPHGGERVPHSVQSLQLLPSGVFAAAIADPGCVDYEPPAISRPASRYELRGGRWRVTSDRGGDVQLAGADRAVLRLERPPEAGARLVLEREMGGTVAIADDVDQLAGRP